MEDLEKKQVELELDMLVSGAEAYYRASREAEESGRGADTDYASTVIKQVTAPVGDYIGEVLVTAAKAKRTPLYATVLATLGAHDAAVLGLRTVFTAVTRRNNNGRPVTRTSLANEIGKVIQTELKARSFADADKRYADKVVANWNKRGSSDVDYRNRALNKLLANSGNCWKHWGVEERVKVGSVVLQCILERLDFFEVRGHNTGGGKMTAIIVLAETAIDFIEKHKEFMALLHPPYKPMLVPPADWGVDTKPYRTEQVNRTLQFVRTRYRKMKLRPDEVDPRVYAAVNRVQSTPWRVHLPTLKLAQAALAAGVEGLVPPAGDDIPPPCPLPATLKKEHMDERQTAEFKAWKSVCRSVHNANATNRGSRLRYYQVLRLALEFHSYPNLYFPHNVDSRGRIYPIPTVLNPQGDDLAKGLLEFNYAEVLTEEGVRQLKLHVANKYGLDKASTNERLSWFDQMESTLLAVAEHPLDNLELLREADSPYQFYQATCWYRDWKDNPLAPNHARVNKDGACNGLQHFAMMVRDGNLAESVNLIGNHSPDVAPKSVYKVIAEEVDHLLREDHARGEELAILWASFWRKYNEGKVDYKCMKRPVMTLPYSATMFSRRDYIRDYIAEKGLQSHFGALLSSAVGYLAEVVTKAMERRIAAATRILDWMVAAASNVLDKQDVVQWVTPVGFKVRTFKPKQVSQRVVIKYLGRRVEYGVRKDVDGVNKQKVLYAVVPNFVHSMDAAHLCMVANTLVPHLPLHVVHDDFGTHANHGELLVSVLLKTLSDMYSDNSVNLFAEQQEVPTDNLPLINTFNVQDVLASKYAFD